MCVCVCERERVFIISFYWENCLPHYYMDFLNITVKMKKKQHSEYSI